MDAQRTRGRVWFQINWQTGASSEHWLSRRVRVYAEYADVEELRQRVCELNAAQQQDDEIARILNAEGRCGARGRPFSRGMVWDLRKAWGIPTVKATKHGYNPARWEDGSYSVEGAAATLGVYDSTIRKWLRRGRLQGEQQGKGMPWHIPLTEEQITQIKARLQHVRLQTASDSEVSL